jgi:CBS domain containing-hemolysin-like protein
MEATVDDGRPGATLVRAGAEDDPPAVGDIDTLVLQVPETKDIDELLVEMREERHDRAVVVDEFGTARGPVTLDDVVEETVGKVLEGVDRPALEPLGGRRTRVGGTANVHEFNEALAVELPEKPEHGTVAGFVVDKLGRLPEPGEVVDHQGVRVEVERMDRTRVRSLLVTVPPAVDAAADASG